MKKFFYCINNGTLALVTPEVLVEIKRRWTLIEEAVREGLSRPVLTYPKPIFTFSDSEYKKEWVTGTLADYKLLTRDCEVQQDSFYVPFSNSIEITGTEEARRLEQNFHTSIGDAIKAFGLVVQS